MSWEVYCLSVRAALASVSAETLATAEAVLRRVRDGGNRVWIIGNGGSAATAIHLECDLSKNANPPLRATALTGLATLTAYANDDGYGDVFSRALLAQGQAGDVLIAISTSGRSPNVIAACQVAGQLGIQTIGLTAFSGGVLKHIADVALHVATNEVDVAEDVHMSIGHELTRRLHNDPK